MSSQNMETYFTETWRPEYFLLGVFFASTEFLTALGRAHCCREHTSTRIALTARQM